MSHFFNDLEIILPVLISLCLQFDFRIYVLITSMDPVRIYLYKNGLVR
jgi:hypothetical protein